METGWELPRPLAGALAWLLSRQPGSCWLVGGALRDRLLGRPVKDLDLVLEASPLHLGPALARATGGRWVRLDEGRAIGRILWTTGGGAVAAGDACRTGGGAGCVMDLALLAGPDLPADLAARDFGVNTLALPLGPEAAVRLASGGAVLRTALLDPQGGLADLDARCLRMIAPANLAADPVRLLRAVRLATELGLALDPATSATIRSLAELLHPAPPERLRAEWLRALAAPDAARALDLAEDLGLLDVLLPPLAAARACPQSPPHDRDVHRHSLDAARAMAWLLSRILDGPEARPVVATASPLPSGITLPDPFADAIAAEAPRLCAYFQQAPSWDEQPRRAWLVLGALLHDLGKPVTARLEGEGAQRWRYPGHALEGAALAKGIAGRLRAAGPATAYLDALVAGHMLPLWLSTGAPPDDRALHRYFRAAGPCGVDIALLALADNAAKGPLPLEAAERLAGVFRRICRAWFEERDRLIEVVLPLGGRDLIEDLGLSPGPQLAQLLGGLREAVAAGDLPATDRAAALDWVRRRI